MPKISVVVPTYLRESRLRFALEGLATQSLDLTDFEVIVVRAPGAPEPYASAPEGLGVTFIEAPIAGPAAQRNAGWRNASAPVVAFMDDDCRPGEGWLETLLATSDNGVIVQGRTLPDPDEAHLLTGLARSIEITGPTVWFETCNIAYRRDLLELVGGFDEGFELLGSEDTDLGLRAESAGARLTFASGALVWHAVVPRGPVRAFREARRRAWLPRLIARHPSQRKALYGGLFVNRAHAAIAASAVLCAVTRGRIPLRLGLAFVPFVAHNVALNRGTGLRTAKGFLRFGLSMPFRLTLDIVEVAWTLRGSAAHRSLVI